MGTLALQQYFKVSHLDFLSWTMTIYHGVTDRFVKIIKLISHLFISNKVYQQYKKRKNKLNFHHKRKFPHFSCDTLVGPPFITWWDPALWEFVRIGGPVLIILSLSVRTSYLYHHDETSKISQISLFAPCSYIEESENNFWSQLSKPNPNST